MDRVKISGKQIAIGAGIVVLILLLADFNNRVTELYRLTAQREHIAAEATALMQTQAVLQADIEYATSVAAVEEWAYEQGKMIRAGENPIILLPDGETQPLPSPATPEPTAQADAWEMWIALFFDE